MRRLGRTFGAVTSIASAAPVGSDLPHAAAEASATAARSRWDLLAVYRCLAPPVFVFEKVKSVMRHGALLTFHCCPSCSCPIRLSELSGE
jgi:hypothetical protein